MSIGRCLIRMDKTEKSFNLQARAAKAISGVLASELGSNQEYEYRAHWKGRFCAGSANSMKVRQKREKK